MAQKSSARGTAQKSGDHASLTREPSRIGEQSWQLPDVASRCASMSVDAARKKQRARVGSLQHDSAT
jgi:hypothetical protein